MSDSKKPLVSVIIPAYNHERYIRDALESVVNQTYSNMEIIVINDGSNDNTANVIQDFIKNCNKNIKFIDKNNEGVCKTLNLGLSIAKGEYISFLASDDMWHKDIIQKQVDFLNNNENIGMVYSDAFFINNNEITNRRYTQYKQSIKKYFKNGIQNCDVYDKLLCENIIISITTLTRKECFDKVGVFDDNLLYEDYDMWLRIAKKYPIGFINEPLAYYRLHDNNISNSISFMIKGTLQTILKQFRYEPLKDKSIFRKILILIRFLFTIAKNKIVKITYRINIKRISE